VHEAASQELGRSKQPKTGPRRGLPFHAGMKMVGMERVRQPPLVFDWNDPAQGQLGRGAKLGSPPATHQFFLADQTQELVVLVEELLLAQLAYKPEGAHHRNLGRSGKLGGVAITSPRSIEELFGEEGRKQYLEHPLVEIGEQIRGLGQRMLLPASAARRVRVQFFEARPYEEPEAFPIDYPCGDIGGDFGQKVHQPIGGTGSDHWRGNDRERRRRLGRGLGEGPGLKDGLR
jgi:hypothetical protein